MSNDKENFLEKTTEIKQGHADVGIAVKAVIFTMTAICVIYLVLNLF